MSSYVVSTLASKGKVAISAPIGGGQASGSGDMEVDYITGKKGNSKGKSGKEQKGAR